MAAVQPQVAIPPAFTVYDAKVACGVNDAALFDGDTPAERITADLFGDDFATCMDKGFLEIDNEFKTYLDLTANQGQIRLLPGTKRNIKAFIQHVHHPTGRPRNRIPRFISLRAPHLQQNERYR
jgi:hypothetical protein